jgi:hypothetical protein
MAARIGSSNPTAKQVRSAQQMEHVKAEQLRLKQAAANRRNAAAADQTNRSRVRPWDNPRAAGPRRRSGR